VKRGESEWRTRRTASPEIKPFTRKSSFIQIKKIKSVLKEGLSENEGNSSKRKSSRGGGKSPRHYVD